MKTQEVLEIYENLERVLKSIIGRYIGYLLPQDVEDIMQESFLEHLLHPKEPLFTIVNRARMRVQRETENQHQVSTEFFPKMQITEESTDPGELDLLSLPSPENAYIEAIDNTRKNSDES